MRKDQTKLPNSELDCLLQKKDKRLLKRLPWDLKEREGIFEALGVGQIIEEIDVRSLRKREKLSQRDFCRIYQVSLSTLKAWESGTRQSRIAKLYLNFIRCFPNAARKSLNIKV